MTFLIWVPWVIPRRRIFRQKADKKENITQKLNMENNKHFG